jgi:hypothetical protein
VAIDATPTSPADAEQISEVRIAPVPEAQRLLRIESKWEAELVALAVHLRMRFAL